MIYYITRKNRQTIRKWAKETGLSFHYCLDTFLTAGIRYGIDNLNDDDYMDSVSQSIKKILRK